MTQGVVIQHLSQGREDEKLVRCVAHAGRRECSRILGEVRGSELASDGVRGTRGVWERLREGGDVREMDGASERGRERGVEGRNRDGATEGQRDGRRMEGVSIAGRTGCSYVCAALV